MIPQTNRKKNQKYKQKQIKPYQTNNQRLRNLEPSYSGVFSSLNFLGFQAENMLNVFRQITKITRRNSQAMNKMVFCV